MHTRRLAVVAVLVVLPGCSPSAVIPTDGGTDAASPDAAGRDAGVADPCATDEAHATSTIGCNGGLAGPAAPNEFGGACAPGPSQPVIPLQGSCTSPDDVCAGYPGQEGICLRHCDPAPTYVSTGTCPRGSRCFVIDLLQGNVFCFPDCWTGSDCAGGVCDNEGGCEFPTWPGTRMPTDGGVGDGGTDTGVPIDAGTDAS